MSKLKISEAGKRSSDPAQQHLREQKAIWNAAAKSLIAKLIYFKRGINGRGEAKAGLPASKIQFPLPAEIGSYLDGIATDFAALVDGAEGIIQEQEHYSQVRRKSQPQGLPANDTAPLLADDGLLVAEASWFGSRLWAKTVGLRGEGKEHLVSMIDHANEVRKTLEDLENILTSSNPNSIASAVTAATMLGFSSIKSYRKSYNKYNELYDKLKQKEDENRNKLNSEKQENSEAPSDLKITKPESKPKTEENIAPEPKKELIGIEHGDLQEQFFTLNRKFQLAKKDVSKGNKVIELTYQKIPQSPHFNNFKDSVNILGKDIQILKSIKKAMNDPSNDNYVTAINELSLYTESYFAVAIVCSDTLELQIVPENLNNFDAFKIMSSKLGSKKEAGVKSYLKKRWMKFVNTIVSDKTETVKLQALDQIVLALDEFNVLLNTLETPGVSQEKINSDTVNAFKKLSPVYISLITLVELHNTKRDQEKINGKKNIVLFAIQERQIKKLKEILYLILDMVNPQVVRV